ncbi:hypothetical protein NKH73_22795 [Mesorhizobium sp. M0938]|uniref:hypothetical protein n=1 Tax=unclassified Mesorhizobium TaxID=325217 RepID=UPI003338FA52
MFGLKAPVLWVLRRVPLFGQVFEAKPSSIVSSFYETLVGTIFSTLPIWFFPIFFSNSISGGPGTFELFVNSIRRGDLFIYSAALVGPLIYTITKNYAEVSGDEEKKVPFRTLTFEFPYGPSFVIIAVFICMMAAICYGISNLASFPGAKIILMESFLIKASVLVYIFSLLCLFAVSAYRNEFSTLNRNLSEDERTFFKDWKNRK